MRRLRRALLLLLGLAAALGGRGAALAQPAPLHLVNERTQVRAINFRFVDSQTFEPSLLKEQVALTAPAGFLGSVALQERLSFIPFVPDVSPHPFLPIEMQKDAVRLERFYNRNGFLYPEVDWLVRLDSARNTVNILYTIREGPPLRLEELRFRGLDGGPAVEQFPSALREDWRRFRERSALQRGVRLTDFRLLQLQDQTLGWVRDQGYAFAEVSAESEVDSLRNEGRVTIVVDAGPRGRVSEIVVEGVESVSERVVTRELPFEVGDRFSYSKLVEGQREVFGLNLFQIALADVPQDQPRDSSVVVRLRVREGNPRVVTGGGSYLTEAGLTGQAQWTHRNFFGGARTFTAGLNAQTGIGAFTQSPDIVYRASVSLRQPYFFNRRLSYTVAPYAETRDNEIDASTAFGGDVTLLYELDPLKTASLQYGFETRDVERYSFGSSADDETSYIELVQAATLEPGRVNRNALGLSGTYGRVDDALNPRRGFILRPAAAVAGPPSLSTVEYGRFRLAATGYVPVTRSVSLVGRLTGGRLTPFGKSVPTGPLDAFGTLLTLRDALFFNGGTADVRGWGNLRLGPKALDLIFFPEEDEDTGDSTIVFEAGPYFPLGTLAKFSGSIEARMPFPGLGESWGTHAFFDAGRAWSPDERFDLPESFLLSTTYDDPERLFYGAGAGFSVGTAVGAVRFSVAYKLNPTFFDLRSPTDMAEAIQRAYEANPDVPLAELGPTFEEAIRGVEPNALSIFGLFSIPQSNRIHLHLSIGQTF
jgi:outer membrane protein insertion porin family